MDDLLHSPPNSRDEGGEMIDCNVWTEIHARARRGEAEQKIARELGLDRKTVRRLLAQVHPRPTSVWSPARHWWHPIWTISNAGWWRWTTTPIGSSRSGNGRAIPAVMRWSSGRCDPCAPSATGHGKPPSARDAPWPPSSRRLGEWVGVDGGGASARACLCDDPGLFACPVHGVHGG